MNCDQCGHAEATIHVTDVVGHVRHDRHLCSACASAANLFESDSPGDTAAASGLNLTALVELVFGGNANDPTEGELICRTCGLDYAAFCATGRLGCPAEYDEFEPRLRPLLDRLHAHSRHAGKRPRTAHLKTLLAAAVTAEDYAAAAGLRDQLRQKERDG